MEISFGYIFYFLNKLFTNCIIFVQVIDLSSVSPDLEYIAADADLVVLEGMVCASNEFFRGFDPYFLLCRFNIFT